MPQEKTDSDKYFLRKFGVEKPPKKVVLSGHFTFTDFFNESSTGIIHSSEPYEVVAIRRDLTYPMASFMLALRDMRKRYNHSYFDFREVIRYCKEYYKTTPSDYALLENRWLLITSNTATGKKNEKKLTKFGWRFIQNEMPVKMSHFINPLNKNVWFLPRKITMLELQNTLTEGKDDKQPFFNVDDNEEQPFDLPPI